MNDIYRDPAVGAGPPAIDEVSPPARTKTHGGVAMRPDVTKVQGGAAGLFVALLLGLPQAGYDGRSLDIAVVAAAVVAATAIYADAKLRAARNAAR